jgi:hypothetical protein
VSSQTEAEPGEGITLAAKASGVRAVISTPTGGEVPGPGGGAERIDAQLVADVIATLDHTDLVTDADGNEYEVAWVAQREGFGLEHTTAGLVAKSGRTPGG